MEAAGTVTATGHGRATGPPDTATVSLGVEVRAATAAEALSAANERAAALIAAIRAHGVEAPDLRTRDVSLYPQYDNNGHAITAYVAGNQVSATIRDIERVGSALDGIAREIGDAVRFNGLAFAISDPTELVRQARQAAVADALDRATQLAALTGATLGPVVDVVEGSTAAPPVPRFAKAMAMDAAVPIEAGSQGVAVDVTVTYRLAAG